MLWTIAGILALLWALGLVSGYIMGPFIHLLLVFAVVLVLVQVVQVRRRGKPAISPGGRGPDKVPAEK